jgi:hypothetical protein
MPICNAIVKTFVGSALSVGKFGSFYGPIKRSNIKTFSDMNKKTKLKCRSGETVQGCRSVFIVSFIVRGNQPRSDFHCCIEVSHDMSCNQCRFLSGETTNTTQT